MFIAVASKTGVEVDQHFGHAERFLIYDYAQGHPKKVDEAVVGKYCSFDPDHPFRQDKFTAIVEAIRDCRAVVSVRIGDLPRLELKKRGIEAINAEGPIEDALRLAHETLCGCACRKCE